jgi:formylglycine-generating enzyme required for sulfatase activity
MTNLESLMPTFIMLPAASFLMGTPVAALSGLAKQYGGTRESYREESPQHHVALPGFAIAATPVTNGLYEQYVLFTGAVPPIHWRGPQAPVALRDHPVVNICWHDALAFCQWLSDALPSASPVRLPHESEWEFAARGTDGRTFPWGMTFANLGNTRESGHATTTVVGSYPGGMSPWGALDMAGNVWEWTASLDALYPYQSGDGREDLVAPGRRVLRGGCYANPHGFARCACRFRMNPALSNDFIGFRLARDTG